MAIRFNYHANDRHKPTAGAARPTHFMQDTELRWMAGEAAVDDL